MASGRSFYDTYARDLRAEDVERLFTRDARDAYEYFARGIDAEALPTRIQYDYFRCYAAFYNEKTAEARGVAEGAEAVLRAAGIDPAAR